MTRDEAMNILGVSASSTKDEIKTWYRRKAQQYHPDRNKSRDATKQFQRIQAAYELLKDGIPAAQKPHTPPPKPQPPPKPKSVTKFGVTEVFEDSTYTRDDWGGSNMSSRRSSHRKLRHIEVTGTLEAAFAGGPVTIPVPDNHSITGSMRQIIVLPGVFDGDLIATVPVGASDSVKVKFKLIHDKEYTLVDRWGTLRLDLEVDALRLIVGGPLRLKMIDGEFVEIMIPKGSGGPIIVSGRGFWNDRGSTRGDCVLHVKPLIKELHSYAKDDIDRLRKML